MVVRSLDSLVWPCLRNQLYVVWSSDVSSIGPQTYVSRYKLPAVIFRDISTLCKIKFLFISNWRMEMLAHVDQQYTREISRCLHSRNKQWKYDQRILLGPSNQKRYLFPLEQCKHRHTYILGFNSGSSLACWEVVLIFECMNW